MYDLPKLLMEFPVRGTRVPGELVRNAQAHASPLLEAHMHGAIRAASTIGVLQGPTSGSQGEVLPHSLGPLELLSSQF